MSGIEFTLFKLLFLYICFYFSGYKKHTDCIENSSDRRDRMATVLVYLDTVKKGGETRFPGKYSLLSLRISVLKNT